MLKFFSGVYDGNVSIGSVFLKQPSTIKDVAKLAQCGVATVSRVLNNTGPASAETRERVLDAVETLQFEFVRQHTRKETVA